MEQEGLTKEKLDKIAMLQMKYDIEVMHLAEECNMEPEFVKNILKDFREPAFKKLRKCSAWNAWQVEWWQENQELSVMSPNAQQKCAMEWNDLDAEKKEQYTQAADKMNECRSLNKTGLIKDLNKRKIEINKQIKELRKIYKTLYSSCGVDILSIAVSYVDGINPNWFGTKVGEDFYAQCDTLDQILTVFQSYSTLKKAERDKVINNIEMSHDVNAIQIKDVSVNSKKTRDNVRQILREKFRMATGKELIPYKNWQLQTKYQLHGWPHKVEFVDYANLTENDKVKVLNALNDIHFTEN
ncbi:hypothetical protein RhiirA5_427163 [Rhizophagus irregularis]|uniref:Uncharacterized protein n=2 Tax=Rhizophagus irregularis TaxID=588596 RepID=U9TX44_RHIID|nr:hypothetical protein GLOIN_2v1782986 [Rhizophagus irregularis DAOM 181602=DAOM 197198]PKC01145.1 hypothetical protein RhiirA5_427163 [Rhizophagus irregularis]PKC67843.1 hypothetical protein RhiirA1_393389 [Rhizophagus irregularis]PKY27457.1 hypothetical protein RhiirB3_443194 [Rhizophagus irregularis]POG64391.1 hypothetical protein GLOIN_2v1782986 [Rhizophagus irregularis DAOM 181602=DAOM 197198]UZO04280.1 hypothetical protein OCT59_024671 [Rhizophagus irregularis]|eukprot:XP_025171257.1 hypothetical protein GLOIN_2v1782986 [Rhizophagus irregularis DAOM 181602=DAOM 197198]